MIAPDQRHLAPLSHAQSWLQHLPLRWGRNVGIIGLAISTASLLLTLLSSGTVSPSLVTSHLATSAAFAFLSGLVGLLACFGLRKPFRRSPTEAVGRITPRFVTGAAVLTGALLLIEFLFQWREGHRLALSGNAAEDAGYCVGFVGSAALLGFLVSLVSKWGLRRAIKRDGTSPGLEHRESLISPVAGELATTPGPGPISVLPARRSINFIAQHWRGENSLAWSYWGVAVVGYALALGAITGVGLLFSTDKGFDPGPIFWLRLATWSIVFVVLFWQVVGTWRSATHHAACRTAANLGTGWATAAKIMLVLGVVRTLADFAQGGALQLAETYDMAFRGDPRMPAYSLRVMRNGTEIEVSGGFKFGLTADFERVVSASPQIRVVHLTSGGGRLGEAAKLGKAISRRGLLTYVPTHCESACTLAFAAGRERWLHRSGKLGFHGPAFPGTTTADLEAAASAWKTQYRTAGFAQSFVDRALAVPSAEIWYPTMPELTAARAVTSIADGSEFAASGYETRAAVELFAKNLAKNIPAFGAMQARLPQDFQRIAGTYYDGYMNGLSETELIAALREQLIQVIQVNKARADDAVLIGFAKVALDRYVALGQRNPSLCYRYVTGVGGPVNISNEVPQASIQRELALGEQAIATSAPRPPIDPQILETLMNRVQAILAKRFTAEKLGIFQLPSVPPVLHADYCNITAAMYQEILALPPAEAALILRSFETQ
ncbi:hypothetical protein [Bosea psychrotolerans]|uniref:Uncharacterized protein n=1 Tax=Bosea psychrotolerans TaxID=1871628 RepID=A0A2S4M2P9_9HYPH|nr:hypothetical protein [Bosea psychrotolerans]POR48982.1 hypothetical protein CYD53_113113 [Bosea psychrotolerans]